MAKRNVEKNRKAELVASIASIPWSAWVVVGAAMLIAGCGAARPVKYYQLTVPGDMSSTTDANTIPVTLLVGPLTGSHLYRDDRIVYSSGDAMGMYDTHRWASPPTEMMQEVLFRELRASGKFKTVNTLRSNARGDYLLSGRLYDFKEVTGSPFAARVAVEYSLRDSKTGDTVWSHYYSHDEPVSGKDVASVASAVDKNVQGIVGQVKSSLEQYFAAHPPAANAPSPASD
ncbi:MAG TPA: ABC-type transport auxiliary lipoprotein family protein [Candidatus Acidoferrum sp.]